MPSEGNNWAYKPTFDGPKSVCERVMVYDRARVHCDPLSVWIGWNAPLIVATKCQIFDSPNQDL